MMTETTTIPLADSFTLVVNGDVRVLDMTYGMLNELTKLVASPEQIPMLTLDPDLREAVMKTLLSKRDAKGRISEEANLMDMRMSFPQVSALMTWVAGHTLSFLLSALEGTQSLQQEFGDRAQKLTSSLSGSKA